MSITGRSTRGTGWSAGSGERPLERLADGVERVLPRVALVLDEALEDRDGRGGAAVVGSSIAPAIGAAWMNVVRSVRNRPISSSGLMPPSSAEQLQDEPVAERHRRVRLLAPRELGLQRARRRGACAKPSARCPASRRRWPRATRRRSTISSSAPASAASRRPSTTSHGRPASRSARRRTRGRRRRRPAGRRAGGRTSPVRPSVNVTSTSAISPRMPVGIGVLDPDRVGDRHGGDPPALGPEPPLADQEPGERALQRAPSWARRAPRPTTRWSGASARARRRPPPRARRAGAGTRSSRTARA